MPSRPTDEPVPTPTPLPVGRRTAAPRSPDDEAGGDDDPLLALAATPLDASTLATAVELSGALRDLSRAVDAGHRAVSELLDLRGGQLRALEVLAAGVDTVAAVADELDEHPDAAAATLASLLDAELVRRDEDGRYRLSTRGRARLDQAVALEVRALSQVPPPVAEAVLGPVRALRGRLDEDEPPALTAGTA